MPQCAATFSPNQLGILRAETRKCQIRLRICIAFIWTSFFVLILMGLFQEPTFTLEKVFTYRMVLLVATAVFMATGGVMASRARKIPNDQAMSLPC